MCKSVYVLKVYSIHYTMRQNTNVKKIPLVKINGTKNVFVFFCQLELITVLLLICDSDMS